MLDHFILHCLNFLSRLGCATFYHAYAFVMFVAAPILAGMQALPGSEPIQTLHDKSLRFPAPKRVPSRMAARRASVKIINFLERQIGVDLDGDGDVGIENRPDESTFHYQAEEEEEEEEVLESEKEAAQRAFNLMMQRTGGVLASSSESSEEEEAPSEPIERTITDSGILRIRSPKTIRDHYTLLELLHEGSGRRVYFCEDFQERRPCIVKLWYKAAFAKRELDAVIENQLKLMRLPHHPNVVHPQHLLEDEVCHYAEFDVVFAGSSLFQVIVSDASTTEQWIKRVFRGLCRGLAHLHANGFIHGDIKPENVLLQWQDYQELLSKHAKHPRAWVSVKRSVLRWKCPTQFKTAWTRHQLVAQARIIDLDTASAGSSKTKICGTPGYMAPEEYVGASTQAGDLFAATRMHPE